MPDPFVFTRLHLQRPVSTDATQRFVGRLSASDVPRPLSFEVRASDSGVQYILGCPATALHTLKHLISGAFPGTVYEGADRQPLASSGYIEAHQQGLPTATLEPEALTSAIFTALDARKKGETLVLQVVLGPAHSPELIHSDVPDPLQPLSSRLWHGVRKAAPDTRRKLQEHAAVPRLSVVLRLGVDGPDPKRREALIFGLFGSLQTLNTIGVRFKLRRERPRSLHDARPARGRLQLTPRELTPLLGWALGEGDFPGVDPLHPKRLAVPADVSLTESVFAVGTAPGPKRPIGFDPLSRLQHAVASGPTGSGKSVLLEALILSDIEAGRACVVVEPKRQLVDAIIAHAPASAAGQIVVLDAADPLPVGFNPLDLADDDDPYVVGDNILAAFAALFADGWGPRTEYLIQGALVTLLIAGQRRGTSYTLIDLPLILTDAPLRHEATKYVSDDPTLQAFWREFEEMPVRQRVNQIAAPLNKLRKLAMRKNLVALLGQPTPRFRLRDIWREGKTVLVPLNEALIGKGAANFLGSLVLAELWTATLKRATEKDPQKRPGMIFVDEVQNYLHLPTDIGDAMATSRSYGVAWHVAHQFRKQLPPAMREGFDTNARSRFVFTQEYKDASEVAKSALDLTTEDFQTLGKYEIYSRLVTANGPTRWFSARTLPAPPPTGAAEAILSASRELYGMRPKAPEDPPPAVTPAVSQAPSAAPKRPRGQRARRT